MTKTGKVMTATVLMALTGYGVWTLYKKYNPEAVEDMENCMSKMSKNVEKSIENMM